MAIFLDFVRSQPLFKTLCNLQSSEDGNLLEQTDDLLAEAQVEFLRWAIHQANPSVIVETGTNKGFFAYLMSWICRTTIYTFDINPHSARAIDLINQQQHAITAIFTPGDTRDTLQRINVKAGFAWIDGGHTENIPYSDLLNCARLQIKYVAVDDTVYPDVQAAIGRILWETPYEVVGNPFAQFDRRGAVLLKLGAEY